MVRWSRIRDSSNTTRITVRKRIANALECVFILSFHHLLVSILSWYLACLHTQYSTAQFKMITKACSNYTIQHVSENTCNIGHMCTKDQCCEYACQVHVCTYDMCMKNFAVKNQRITPEIFKFELTKHGPLSVAIMLGSSNWANRVFNCWIVTLVMDKCIGKASIHLDPVSIITRNI